MPEIPTYTASGQTRGGPVLADTPAEALTAPYRALERTGYQVAQLGSDVAQIAEQRNRENDLRWATEASAQYSRTLAERRAADAQNPRETEGIEFRDFADEQLNEYQKTAPSARARDMFRSHGLSAANAGYERALHSGEQTRLINADLANDKSTADIVSTYKTTAQLDNPVGAAQDISGLVNSQLASINTRFGTTMPALAEKMRKTLVSEVALGTASTNPEYARQLVESAPIEEKFKYTLNNEIDRIEKDANASMTFAGVTMQENRIAVGYDKLTPVAPPPPGLLKALPPNQAEALKFHTDVANRTISEFSKVKSWNWQAQQEAVKGINIENDPVAQKAREKLVELLQHSQKQQTEDAYGWQSTYDSEFNKPNPNETPAQRVVRIDRMVSLQGPAPIGSTPEQQKRYLNLPTGLQKASSVQKAEERAARYNNTPPNALTALLGEVENEFPDPKVAAMVWNDMQNLPEGKKLNMGIRVAMAIKDDGVRNNWLGALNNPDHPNTEDSRDKYVSALNGRDSYNRFVSGWRGDGNQRGKEAKEFEQSITSYAQYLSVAKQGGKKLSMDEAIDLAVKRVITDNYGLMQLHGSDVPVYRYPKAGGYYDDAAVRNMEFGITDLLDTISTDTVSTDLYHFPLQPRLPGSQVEADRYLRKAIRASGTVVTEADGKSATVYMKGDGVNDFPFQARGKDGNPLLFDFADVMARGAALQKYNELIAGRAESVNILQSLKGVGAEQYLLRREATDKLKEESLRRLGINPKTGYKIK